MTPEQRDWNSHTADRCEHGLCLDAGTETRGHGYRLCPEHAADFDQEEALADADADFAALLFGDDDQALDTARAEE
jgi:hypothetical protein